MNQYKSIYDLQEEFYREETLTETYDEIPVPGIWQNYGYDSHQYIERWKRAYGQVTEKEIKKLEMEKALKKLLEDFFYVWNFRVLDTAFVREFLKHKNDDRYKRAMIVLIELMDKETKYFPELTKREANIWLIREIRDADEMIEINAYLGMLRNHLRRKEILGF